MGIPIIGDVIDAVKDIVSEVVVDKDKKNELNVRLQELADKASQREHEQVLAQIAGWRPFVGWAGGAGLVYSTIIEPLASWLARINGYLGEFPVINNELLLYVLGGMLGIGGLRTFEKIKGVSTTTLVTKKEETPTQEAPSLKKSSKFKL
jgi:hypothetical protein